jgi:hypothetical protein
MFFFLIPCSFFLIRKLGRGLRKINYSNEFSLEKLEISAEQNSRKIPHRALINHLQKCPVSSLISLYFPGHLSEKEKTQDKIDLNKI